MEYNIRKQLEELADEKFRKFTSSLNPGKDNILGVRLPQLRTLAKQILKEDWRAYLKEAKDDSMEEVILQGMVIGGCKAQPEEILALTKDYIPKIDCWIVCDTFCSGLKLAKKHRALVWDFIQPYLYSGQEFELRFGVVMLLHFLTPEYAPRAFDHFNRIKHEGYYVKMAVAWVLSMYFVHLPELTMEYLKNNTLDDFTYNKALQKIIESFRVDGATKDLIRSMKRK